MTALRFWFKLGFISFGGPAGQIAIMHQELVEHRRWISERRFLHALNFCMVLPGPEAQQLAIYIGWLLHRTPGALVAGTLFVLPSLCFLIFLSWVYMAFGHLPIVAAVFYGVKPAITAIVFQAAHRLGSRTLRHPALWVIAIAAFLAITVVNIPFPIIVIGAGLVGYFGAQYHPAVFATAGHPPPKSSDGPALIDDQSPTPPHAQFRWSRLARLIVIGLLLWSIPLLLLVLQFGWHGLYTEMALFFSKAALLTFGGAYAVLPYVYQAAVEHYGWLSAAQMIDGLALGETTPGPLIMVVAFVGFVGGYLHEHLPELTPFLAGTGGALIVAWFTFLPSFLFILIGGPIMEATHGNLRLTAPLMAISAAVVGVILTLALFFGYHTLWPQGLGGMPDWTALMIGLLAGVALFRYKISALTVIASAALMGGLIRVF